MTIYPPSAPGRFVSAGGYVGEAKTEASGFSAASGILSSIFVSLPNKFLRILLVGYCRQPRLRGRADRADGSGTKRVRGDLFLKVAASCC